MQIALSHWHLRQYDDAIEWANRTLELDPGHLLAREFIAAVYWKKGDFDRQMAETIKHAQSHGVPTGALDQLERAYANGGRPALWHKCLARHRSKACRRSSLPCCLPRQEISTKHSVSSISPAERHDPSLVHLAVAPQWDGLRVDPRFEERLRRMGLREG